jgi:two-component system sensor histidine kinase RpfC
VAYLDARLPEGLGTLSSLRDRARLVAVTDEAEAGLLEAGLRPAFAAALGREEGPEAVVAALRISAFERPGSRDEGADAETGGPERAAVRSLSILVADDNRTNQKVLAKILERGGHRAHLVDNGKQALDALQAHAFDLAFMDLNMPIMNGIEATKLYRLVTFDAHRIPIIALTADATPEARRRCEAAGMDGCLLKPIEPARLLGLIAAFAEQIAGRTDEAGPSAALEALAEPGFGEPGRPGVDERTLAQLAELGGREFLEGLVAEYLADADATVGYLRDAVALGDDEAFREHAHALRSASANIGALGIYEMCLAWRRIDAREIDREGAAHVQALGEEVKAVRAGLERHLAGFAEPSRRAVGG